MYNPGETSEMPYNDTQVPLNNYSKCDIYHRQNPVE